MPHTPAASVLSDVTVLDLTRVRAGPTCVRQLADWGADVIRVEIPPALEGGGGLAANRHGSDFQNLHRNKRSLTLNLKEEEGLKIFRELVASADVVVENYRPDVKDRLGIGYDVLAALNPRNIFKPSSSLRLRVRERAARFRFSSGRFHRPPHKALRAEPRSRNGAARCKRYRPLRRGSFR